MICWITSFVLDAPNGIDQLQVILRNDRMTSTNSCTKRNTGFGSSSQVLCYCIGDLGQRLREEEWMNVCIRGLRSGQPEALLSMVVGSETYCFYPTLVPGASISLNQLCIFHIPPKSAKFINVPISSFFFVSLDSPTLTMMHLRIMLYTKNSAVQKRN